MPSSAAFLSLFDTMYHLTNSSQITLEPPSEKIFESAVEKLFSFAIIMAKWWQQFGENITHYSKEKLNALDGEIRDTLHMLEDIIESHVSDQLLSQLSDDRDRDPSSYSINLVDIKQDVESLTEAVTEMMEEYLEELDHLLLDHRENKDVAVSSRVVASGGEELSKMVGLSDKFEELKYKLTHHGRREELIVTVTGMAGIGKTALVKKIFKDPLIASHFNCRVWVTAGRNSQLEEILRGVLAQVAPDSARRAHRVERFVGKTRHLKASLKRNLKHVLPHENPDSDKMLTKAIDEIALQSEASWKEFLKETVFNVNFDSDKMLMRGYQKISRHSKAGLKEIQIRILAHKLKKSLKDKRYLIVLDDVWNLTALAKMGDLLSRNNNGSKVLSTTRLRVLEGSDILLNMRLMNEDESWGLFREKVFAKEPCPLRLERAGKKIVERCDGLPLTIVTVSNLLSKANKTPKYWSEVAMQKKHQLFTDAYDEISKVLHTSYDFVPQFFIMQFFYMGVFPQNSEISQSKLMNLCTADGSLLDDKEIIEILIVCNLVMPSRESTSNIDSILTYQAKTCRLHSSMWHLCNKEARKNKFFYILSDRADGLEEGIKGQRRLCIHNNILFGIKDVYNSMENNCASTTRCLLCVGPYHQYPVPICSSLRLLRVLHALTIRLYDFPVQVLKLIMLRYLALTYNGKLPTSISKLYNLQFLIIHRHLSIKSCGDPSYLPREIWYMEHLKHLEIMGSDLPDPCGASLPNLLTLLGVSPHSCTKDILKAIPNLKKLGIQIELAPDATESLSCFDHISCLHKLESLKCVIMNPKHSFEVVAPLVPMSDFPSSLQKLTLSGLGYPWKEMSKIASLPNLEELKLQCYAFQGPKWEVENKGFKKLGSLLIQDTDLVQWQMGRESFQNLKCLSMKHCYKLEEIDLESNLFPRLIQVEVVDCNPKIMTLTKEMKEAALKEYAEVDVRVHSSWIDGIKIKI